MIELFRTSTFRLALVYFGVFAMSTMLVLGLLYWQTVIYTDRQTDETIDAEIRGLAEEYRQAGLAGLIGVLQERSDPARGSSMLYLLTDERGRPLAGNLDRWPDVTIDRDGWMRFTRDALEAGENRHHTVRATSFVLARNYQLLVGRDLAERSAFTRTLTAALGWSALLTSLLGLGGGLLMSRRVLNRLETVNRASEQVMSGRLDQRIRLRGTGDEFDRVAQNLNAMLDRIQRLMDGMRQVSDNIAHDLRSPLGRLRSRLELLLRGENLSDDSREGIQAAIDDADHLLATFTALLDIAQAESGSMAADMAPLDLVEIVRDLVDFFEPVAEERALGLAVALPDVPFEICGNRHLLSRALANLIGNALKYTPSPGRVTVSVRSNADGVIVTVADTGPGIPEEARERVFDRFVRLEQSRTTEGNGLGLSLARAIVAWHGGTVRLDDNQPGLRVLVTLPASSPDTHRRPKLAAATR